MLHIIDWELSGPGVAPMDLTYVSENYSSMCNLNSLLFLIRCNNLLHFKGTLGIMQLGNLNMMWILTTSRHISDQTRFFYQQLVILYTSNISTSLCMFSSQNEAVTYVRSRPQCLGCAVGQWHAPPPPPPVSHTHQRQVQLWQEISIIVVQCGTCSGRWEPLPTISCASLTSKMGLLFDLCPDCSWYWLRADSESCLAIDFPCSTLSHSDLPVSPTYISPHTSQAHSYITQISSHIVHK